MEMKKARKFTELKGVSEATLTAIQDMGFSEMTEIQEQAIPFLLHGEDVIGSAKTGSGKTLAFLIPVVEKLKKLDFKPTDGTGAIIISPTRELAMQTYTVLEKLMKSHTQTCGRILGGESRKVEAMKLAEGLNIVVATPGRLIDHLLKTEHFKYKHLLCLIIDEADRLLDFGFEQQMKQIIHILPKKRQTVLFSATNTKKLDDLKKLALNENPRCISVDDNKENATVDSLSQGYIICPTEKRLRLLYSFIEQNRLRKIMVFFSSRKSVQFHYELFKFLDLPVDAIHGKQSQGKRSATYHQFCEAESGTLLCTDIAARGLDIPSVDWVVQYDPPDDPKEYIHRVGRTARGKGSIGFAILILRPEELDFRCVLRQSRVPLIEYQYHWEKVPNIKKDLTLLVEKHHDLNRLSKSAFKSYVRAYNAHQLRHIYDVHTLDFKKLSKSFGLETPPAVDLDISTKEGRKRKRNATSTKKSKKEKL